jgi:hypothetical protein
MRGELALGVSKLLHICEQILFLVEEIRVCMMTKYSKLMNQFGRMQ